MLKKRYFPLLTIFAVLFVGTFVAAFLMLFFYRGDGYRTLIVIFGLLSATFMGLDVFLVTRYIIKRTAEIRIANENEYNLGQRSHFFDQDMLSTAASTIKARKRNKKREQYLIAFSASNKRLMQNADRNATITGLNGSVANSLISLFGHVHSNVRRLNHVFGFDRGIFYVYCVGDNENGIKKIIDQIRNEIYAIVERDQIRIFIEPIFGVTRTSSSTLINEDIDNANIARNNSESKFESVTFYSNAMRKSTSDKMVKELIEAVNNKEFVVYYQPKFDLNLRQFTSSEALVRWNSPKYGLLMPSKFIDTAEKAGLIHEIDTFVFKKVCEDLNETKRKGRRLLPVSVNFSLYEFFSTQFLDVILNMLDEYKIDPSLIQIEITETTSQANQFLSITIIKKLQEKGIKILMDDFGVGFSNIGNFKTIPFDVIKIDKSFIDNIENDPKSAEIVKFLIQLCKINEMSVVAEGVDNARQVEVLKKFKCDTIQGYFYSKPIPKDEYDKFLVNNPFEAKEGRRK